MSKQPQVPDVDKLYSCNVVIIPRKITNDSCVDVIRELLALHMVKSNKPISIVVNAAGGEEFVSMQVAEIIMGMKRPTVTYGLGEVCSAGLDIFLAGNKRIATPRTLFLMHQFDWDEYKKGEYANTLEWRRIEDYFQKINYEYMRDRAGTDAADMYLIRGDHWLTAREAKKLGIVHKVVNRINILRTVGLSLEQE